MIDLKGFRSKRPWWAKEFKLEDMEPILAKVDYAQIERSIVSSVDPDCLLAYARSDVEMTRKLYDLLMPIHPMPCLALNPGEKVTVSAKETVHHQVGKYATAEVVVVVKPKDRYFFLGRPIITHVKQISVVNLKGVKKLEVKSDVKTDD